ncbi:protein rogdi homolog isoform X2 [Convolutriloba macropyga]|uniref:protein rogdi homolog isoform X2 n=1 Tax=Convolutriloba macropyga TaxID=536237 RepID=UPI003F52808F
MVKQFFFFLQIRGRQLLVFMELTAGERNSLEREFRWLLQEEMPNLVVQLHKILSDCSYKFFSLNPDDLKSTPGHYVFTNRNNAENFKGVVTLFQNRVTSADLQIKLPTAVQTLRANIREDSPWKVFQIQACSNLLTKMLALLSHHTSNAISYTHSSQIIKLLDQLTGLLNSARKTLDNPPNIDIDTILQDRQKVVFNPPLPSEFSVVFTILRDRLFVNAIHIQPQKTPDNRKVDLRHAMSVGRVEIASRASESSPVPWLTTLIMSISFCLEQSQLMKDKVTMFHQYNIHTITPTTTTAANTPLLANSTTATKH